MEFMSISQNTLSNTSILKKLNYYQNEISYYQDRLQEITTSDFDSEIIHLANKFQEDFSRKMNQIHSYRGEMLKAEAPDGNLAARAVQAHNKAGLDRLVKSYRGLKTCFDLFLQDVSSFQS